MNPTKNRTVKQNRNNSNPHIVYIGQEATETDATTAGQSSSSNKAHFTVGAGASTGTKSRKTDANSSDSDENDCSIYEPEPAEGDDDDDDDDDLVHENPLYNETTFLPSVGIVMASNDGGGGKIGVGDEYIKPAKRSEDVCTMSISSVTDHINMPAGMLENASPIRARSPAPEIRVDDIAIRMMPPSSDMRAASSLSHSTADMRSTSGQLLLEASGGGGGSTENRQVLCMNVFLICS